MPRPRKPRFREATGWWMVEVDGTRVKLAYGRDQKTAAEVEYHHLMAEVGSNPPVDGGDHRSCHSSTPTWGLRSGVTAREPSTSGGSTSSRSSTTTASGASGNASRST